MKNIYLASASKARRELFKIFGLKFKTIPSAILESHRLSGMSYPALVKSNALKKAKQVAEKMYDGIIIGADTIVVGRGKIFGKPQDLKQAKQMLKRLSKKPHWLYTGIAVIDKQRNKAMLDCEKTKIFMDRLTDKQIDKYFKKVSPLDKAGSFDIQGQGAFFIRKIEGCFYNVVGLPLRKLYLILRKAGVLSALVFFCFSLIGCATEYNIVTGEEETFYYSTDREIALGGAIAKQVEKEYKLVDDPLIQNRVQVLGEKIVEVCDRKDIDYEFKVLDDEEVNAVSLPGGYVYVNKGLIDRVDNDDQLAAVLAHEVAHIVARHSIKKLQALQGYSILRILVAQAPGAYGVGGAADAAFTELLLGYSREDELLADKLSARYLRLAGFNPHGMIAFLEKLEKINRGKPLRPRTYFRTHPYISDRIRVTKQELGESINFKDYINIEDRLNQ